MGEIFVFRLHIGSICLSKKSEVSLVATLYRNDFFIRRVYHDSFRRITVLSSM